MIRFLFLLSVSSLLSACSKPGKEYAVNRFAGDSLMIRLADFQDRRMTDSLLHYLNEPGSKYREAVLIALGSVQDSTAADGIGKMLPDTAATVRMAAAFALGQTRCLASEQLLRGALEKEKNVNVRARLYESYGRTTRKWEFFELPQDTIESAGFAWGLFRTAGDSVLDPLAARLLESPAITVRLAASHYFARKAPAPRSAADQILRSALHDRDEDVRMASTLALRKIPTVSVFNVLTRILTSDSSYRVRVNAVSALQGFTVKQAFPVLLRSLDDENLNVVIRAAEVINNMRPDSAWREVASRARQTANFRVKALLYKTALASSRDPALYREMHALYHRDSDPYQRAALLAALGESFEARMLLHDELFSADTAIVRTAAAIALASMNRKYPKRSNEFVHFYEEAISQSDPAVVSVICDVLSDPDLNFRSIIKDWSFLAITKEKFNSSADMETVQSLASAIAYFEGSASVPLKSEFNHPIDWELVKTIKSDQRAAILTSKGLITVRLLVDDAPGTVASFVALVRSGAYANRSFHRVVPNFVAQGGCPRGDGFGSEDYSIRSELTPRRYRSGSMGMASSGKDTESCQWFITHSPTPHLEGAYTIFAEVVEGMEYVHTLEVGDKILKIELSR